MPNPHPSSIAVASTGSGQKTRMFAWLTGTDRSRLLAVYLLSSVENLAVLFQPIALGWAIDGLLRSDWTGLVWFCAQHLSHLAIGTLRRLYDTRLFARLLARSSYKLVLEARNRGIPTSCVAAHSRLLNDCVDFLAIDVPLACSALFSVLGAIIVLGWQSPAIAVLSAILIGPAFLIHRRYACITLAGNRAIHDEQERQVAVIDRAPAPEIQAHFDLLSGWRIRLSDAEALSFAGLECVVLIILATALVRLATPGEATAGSVFAGYRYLVMFLGGLDRVPGIIERVSRFRDIARRVVLDA